MNGAGQHPFATHLGIDHLRCASESQREPPSLRPPHPSQGAHGSAAAALLPGFEPKAHGSPAFGGAFSEIPKLRRRPAKGRSAMALRSAMAPRNALNPASTMALLLTPFRGSTGILFSEATGLILGAGWGGSPNTVVGWPRCSALGRGLSAALGRALSRTPWQQPSAAGLVGDHAPTGALGIGPDQGRDATAAQGIASRPPAPSRQARQPGCAIPAGNTAPQLRRVQVAAVVEDGDGLPVGVGHPRESSHLRGGAEIHPALAAILKRTDAALVFMGHVLQPVEARQGGVIHRVHLAMDDTPTRHRHRIVPQVVQAVAGEAGTAPPAGPL